LEHQAQFYKSTTPLKVNPELEGKEAVKITSTKQFNMDK
jgi:hypothetical protein